MPEKSYSDAEAWEFYKDPANLEPAPDAEVVRRGPLPPSALKGHVPIRFTSEKLQEIAPIAAADGLTVSSWIRHTVDAELSRRAEGEASEPTELLENARRLLDEALDDAIARIKAAAG